MATIEELVKKKTYLDKTIDFLMSVYIYEFDIRAANINCLKTAGRIDDRLYNLLLNSPKMERERYIGNLIKSDKSYQECIDEVIKTSKTIFIQNIVKDTNVVIRIANDSVYFIHPLSQLPASYSLEGPLSNITFIQKNQFTSFLKFDNILVFINTNNPEFIVDVKGINDQFIYLHEPILEIICNCISAKESGGSEIALRIFNDYYNKYVNLSLPIEYYREFNSTGGYKFNTPINTFIVSDVNRYTQISMLDINCNLKVLRTLYSYLLR